jgi:hypothetical protein
MKPPIKNRILRLIHNNYIAVFSDGPTGEVREAALFDAVGQ